MYVNTQIEFKKISKKQKMKKSRKKINKQFTQTAFKRFN